MKKLMIAAAIVCAAALSHGAALDWAMSGITATPAAAVTKDSCAYFIASAAIEDFNSAADKAAWCEANKTYFVDSGTVARSKLTIGDVNGDYATGTDITGFVVVFDAPNASEAGYYVASNVMTVKAPSSGDAMFSAVYGTNTGTWQPNTSAAPEPTSGLLLLLGVAGLALKRKRA